MKGMLKHRRIIFFAVLMFVAYFLTLSISLDDVDSVNLAFGIDNFNISENSPHPPGHPGYVFIAKAFHFIFRDHLLSMTVQSAIFGCLSIIVFYFLLEEMFNKRTAFYASAIMALTPLFWLTSVKALSDMTAMFFMLLSFLFIFRYAKRRNAKDLYIASAIAGIYIGIRFPVPAVIIIPLLAYAYFLKAEEKAKKIAVSAVLFIAASLLWLVPTLIINGVKTYFKLSWWIIFEFRTGKPSISALGTSLTPEYVWSRISDFAAKLVSGGYGINVENLDILGAIFLVLIIILAIRAVSKIKINDSRLHFFAVAMVPYLIAAFVMLPPRDARHLLPFIPALSLVLVLAIASMKKFNLVIFYALFILVLLHSVPLAITIHNEKTPPVQMVEYIKENYDLENTYVITGGLDSVDYHRHFDYYAQDINYVNDMNYNMVGDYIKEGKTVLLTSENKKFMTLFEMTPVMSFSRDSRINTKHSEETTLYHLSLP